MKATPWALGAILVSSLLVVTDASANRYRLVDLGRGSAYALNNRDVIAGYDYPYYQNARWRNGRWTRVSDIGKANAINDRGQIAGYAYAPDQIEKLPIVWERPQIGGARFLGLPEGFQWGEAMAISNDGAVVGYFGGDASGTGCFLAKDGYHTEFLDWPLELGCIPFGMNHNGQIVGYVRTEGHANKAFIWTDGQFEFLPSLNGDGPTQAEDSNDLGDVVGVSSSYDDHAVLWRDGTAVRLDKTDRFVETVAHGINNDGVIVGEGHPQGDGHSDPNWVAVRFEGGRSIPLNSEVKDLNGWHLQYAYSVNNNGVILAAATFSHVYHSVALFPIKDEEAQAETKSGNRGGPWAP